MIDRKAVEKREYILLSDYACKAAESRGRRFVDDTCDIRTCFQHDRDRIIHSKAFRRLMHKTQVFLSPEGDHYRTRLTHTIEVAQIARTIARALALNEDLTEAIAMGHDLGHTPFGHDGEIALREIYPKGFRHNEQSLRVVDLLEKHDGRRGMNLTEEVRDGILNHTGNKTPITLEGQIVKTADRIAYINHDIDDAIRSGVITMEMIPKECLEHLGNSHGQRINYLVTDMIRESDNQPQICMSEEALHYMNILRSFMFEHVYHNNKVKAAPDGIPVREMITSLYEYYNNNPTAMPEEWIEMIDDYSREEIVKDFIASMTDRYATNMYKQLIQK